jgi:hydrogenase/urease accessory protein HupE
VILVVFKLSLSAQAHEISFSHIDLQVINQEITATLEVPASEVAQEFPNFKLGTMSAATSQKIINTLTSRLTLRSAQSGLEAKLLGFEVLAQNLRIKLKFAITQTPTQLTVNTLLFPKNPLHKTFLNLYVNNKLERQTILDASTSSVLVMLEQPQSILIVVWQFFQEGIHHIFIGPDHILFVVGLLLSGGSLMQLFKIVSAFTISHSITLALATFNIINPASSLIEPAIAASIVFVGVHSLLRPKPDLRLWFAFAFGLIHGFGFANALHEMELPRAALAWSLLAFNLGVEFGQGCIVLLVAPILWQLHERLPRAIGVRFDYAAALGVILMGAFWFVERVG